MINLTDSESLLIARALSFYAQDNLKAGDVDNAAKCLSLISELIHSFEVTDDGKTHRT